jgi:hypothetical protein
MTIVQQLRKRGDGHARQTWHRFRRRDAARHTHAWEQENFEEEQARWERGDPEYASLCDAARRAKAGGGQASLHADQAKADWDARVARQRATDDDAQRARHARG